MKKTNCYRISYEIINKKLKIFNLFIIKNNKTINNYKQSIKNFKENTILGSRKYNNNVIKRNMMFIKPNFVRLIIK